MSPGTISGSADPDARLRVESGGREFRRAAPSPGDEATPPADDPAFDGAAFLLIVLLAGFAGLVLLVRPLTEGLAALLGALGVPFIEPGAYVDRATWRTATRFLPAGQFVQIVAGQLLFLGIALAGALLVRGGVRRRLGLVRPRGGWQVVGLALALDVAGLIFGIAIGSTFLPADFEAPPQAVRFFTMMRGATFEWWLALWLAMSMLPALSEEMLFRGLVQRRLLEAWSPPAAVLVTGLVFAFLHPPIVRSLLLLPTCLGLGYVAWRCNSILPGMVMHFGTNAGVQALVRFAPDHTGDVSQPARWIYALIALASGAFAGWVILLLHRRTRRPHVPVTSTIANPS